jgi:hypothetical protein
VEESRSLVSGVLYYPVKIVRDILRDIGVYLGLLVSLRYYLTSLR